MTHKVVFSETAWHDADEIYHWVADGADPQTAERYVDRIVDYCLTLQNFPNRGTPRDDLEPGVRTTAFEGRAVIAYRVENSTVTILRVLNHGRDVVKAFPAVPR